MYLTCMFFGLPVWAWLLIALGAAAAVVLLIALLRRLYTSQALRRLIGLAGFAYDGNQDIFYSEMNAWQRKFGYCYAYDEGAPLLNMIIDSEPVYFRYGGKTWMIELWKGQYGMTTGAEIGVYYTRWPVGKTQKARRRAFYKCVKDKDMLPVSLYLTKNGRLLFSREQRHWWLTGFSLGEFSWPAELAATFSITFPDDGMRDAFTQALVALGYRYDRFFVSGLTVWVRYTTPVSEQPDTRTPQREEAVQAINKGLCDAWQALMDDRTEAPDGADGRLEALRESEPVLYKAATALSKTPSQFRSSKKAVKKERKTRV